MMNHTANREQLSSLYRAMAGLLIAVAVLAFGFVLLFGENWLQIVMAAVGGISLGLIPWMAGSGVNG